MPQFDMNQAAQEYFEPFTFKIATPGDPEAEFTVSDITDELLIAIEDARDSGNPSSVRKALAAAFGVKPEALVGSTFEN